MQSCAKIPLVNTLELLLLILITFCSANDNNTSKPRDKVSLLIKRLSNREILNAI